MSTFGVKIVRLAILKLVQTCNLNCTYCYVYNRGDDSWKTRQKVISDDVIEKFAERIVEHCNEHVLSDFTVEFHGGEPLLIGIRRFSKIVENLKRGTEGINLRFLLQTNGLLLTPEWIDFFSEQKISVGISIDGPPEVNDVARVYHDGKGSTEDLLNRIESVRERCDQVGVEFGYLCVINPIISGRRLIDWFVDQGITSFDLLLPQGNYINPPQGWTDGSDYKRFLIEAFERWIELGSKAPRIRKFELMLAGLLGAQPALDSLGGDISQLVVVETNGAIVPNDVLRFLGGEFSKDEISIFSSTLSRHHNFFQLSEIQEPSEKCKACYAFGACGGGYLQDRFDGETFRNPTIYCGVMLDLASRMVSFLDDSLPSHKKVVANSP